MASNSLLSRKQQWHADHEAFFLQEFEEEDRVSQRTYVFDPTTRIGATFIKDTTARPARRSFMRAMFSYYDGDDMKDCTCCGESLRISDGEDIQRTPCGHLFHFSCLVDWCSSEAESPTPTQPLKLKSCCPDPTCQMSFRILRPEWDDATYSTKHHFENGDLVTYQAGGFVAFETQRARLEHEILCEMYAAMLAATGDAEARAVEHFINQTTRAWSKTVPKLKGWMHILTIQDFRYALYDFIDAPNPFNSFGRSPDPNALPIYTPYVMPLDTYDFSDYYIDRQTVCSGGNVVPRGPIVCGRRPLRK